MTDYAFDLTKDLVIAVLTAVATLAAAYYGAKYAFELQNRKLREDRKNTEAEAANYALFQLALAHHEFRAIDKDFIAPHLTAADRHFSISPSVSITPKLDLNFSSLSFLLRSSDPDLLNRLALAQLHINSHADLINKRNEIHVNELQVVLHDKEAEFQSVTSLAEYERIFGTRLTHIMRDLTDEMITGNPVTLKLIKDTMAELGKVAKTMFTTHDFIAMKWPE